MKTIKEVLAKSVDYLAREGVSNPRRQAEEVLGDALGIKRLQLYLEFDRPLTESELDICRKRIARRGKGEPSQYIHGSVDFLDCKIRLTPDVIIPRQETEILADRVINYLSKQNLDGKQFWDVCCGSGCIGIAVKKRFPQLHVVMSDLSEAALAIAKQNTHLNGVELTFLEGDLLNPFTGMKTHFFVCNPPYVSEKEYLNLDREVTEFEPKWALVAKDNGLEFYSRLSQQLPQFLYPSAKVWFEIGQSQGQSIQGLFSSSQWKNHTIERDWAGKDRFFFLEFE